MKEKELKTSSEWHQEHPHIKILDADGWDRQNWEYSWLIEKITLEEFQRRISYSTVFMELNNPNT